MKLWVFVAGIIVGYVVADNMSMQQRSKLKSARRRVQSGRAAAVVGTVGSGVGDIADAATDRVTGVVDNATSSVADLIAVPETQPLN